MEFIPIALIEKEEKRKANRDRPEYHAIAIIEDYQLLLLLFWRNDYQLNLMAYNFFFFGEVQNVFKWGRLNENFIL